MALAFLKYLGSNDGHQEFQADLGRNSFFRVMIGGYQTHRSYGVSLLERKTFVSKMYGPIPPSKMGRVRFQVPDALFSTENAYLQIVSYREQDERGPAISTVEHVLPSLGALNLPSIQMAMETNRSNNEIISIPFQYRESGVSQAFFLDQVMKFLPKVIPAVGQLLSGGGGNNAGGSSSGGSSNSGSSGGSGGGNLTQSILNLISDPEKLQQILDLLKGVVPGAEVATAAPTAGETPTTAEAASYRNSSAFANGHLSSAMVDPMTIMAVVGAVVDGLAKLGKIGAQINKDELDALQKLNPGVDDPDVQGLLGQMSVYDHSSAMAMDPNMIGQLIGTITDGLEKLGKIGAQINKDELDALMKLNPGVDDPDVQGLLNQMGVSSSYFPRIKFHKSSIVRAEVTHIQLKATNGAQSYIYGYGVEMMIPLKLHTPRDIPRGIFEMVVRRKDSGDVLIRHRMKHSGSQNGVFAEHPTIPAYLSDDLVAGESYDLYLAVLWRGKKNKKFGCCLELPISIAKSYMFERLGITKNVVALNDIEQHRAFWHKVWQADFTNDAIRFEFECKYYYAMESDRSANAQMETVEYLEPARPNKMEGKMKSGLVLSPDVLNDLLPSIGGARLNPDQMEAIKTETFLKLQHRASRTALNFKGKDKEAAALWVYPEVVLREVVLKRAENMTPYGTIAQFTEEIIVFPFAESAHFIGLQSEPK